MTKFDKLLSETAAKNGLIGENWLLKRLLANPKTAAAAEKYLRWTRQGGKTPIPGASRVRTADELVKVKTSLASTTPLKNWRRLTTAGKVVRPFGIGAGSAAGDLAIKGVTGGVPAVWDRLKSYYRLGGDDNATVQPGSPEDMKNSGFADPPKHETGSLTNAFHGAVPSGQPQPTPAPVSKEKIDKLGALTNAFKNINRPPKR